MPSDRLRTGSVTPDQHYAKICERESGGFFFSLLSSVVWVSYKKKARKKVDYGSKKSLILNLPSAKLETNYDGKNVKMSPFWGSHNLDRQRLTVEQ